MGFQGYVYEFNISYAHFFFIKTIHWRQKYPFHLMYLYYILKELVFILFYQITLWKLWKKIVSEIIFLNFLLQVKNKLF